MFNRIVVFLLILSVLTGISSAVSMQVSPTSIEPGDTVQITYSDLLDGSSFSLQIKGKLDVIPDSGYGMDVSNFIIPISLNNGKVSAYADNSEQLSLNYEGGDSTISSITKIGNAEKKCTINENQDVSAKTYKLMSVRGLSSTGNIVNTEISFLGKKSGPDSGTISFVLSGIDHSTINIVCMVDGSIVTNTPIYVGGGSVNAPTPTAPIGNSGNSGSSGGTSAGKSTSSNYETQPDSQSPSKSETGVSVDGEFTYTGKGASNAIIMYDSSGFVPAEWNIEGQAYALISDGNGVDGKVRFSIPASFSSSKDMHMLFIAESVNGKYAALQSMIKGDFIEASISKEGTFALMSVKESTSQVGSSKEGASESKAPVQPEETTTGNPAIMCIVIVGIALAFCQKIKK